MLRYLGSGLALAVLLGAVAACDGRAALLNGFVENAVVESPDISSLTPEAAAPVKTSDAAVSAETTGPRAGGDSLAVLIGWHVDIVRQYEVRRCQPDDRPAEHSSERSATVLDGLESAQRVDAQTAPQQDIAARPKEGNACTAVHFFPVRAGLSCP
jgi:hypothetical protein